MKKLFIILMVMSVFGLISCSNSFNDPDVSGNVPNNPSVLAKVIIPLPKTTARNISVAIANTNLFEAIFYRYKDDGTKYQTTYTATATSGSDSVEISLPVGIYDVLVLAGDRYSSDGGNYSSPILLASGSAENQSIIEGDNTIAITLLSVDFTLVIPSSVEIGATYDVSLQITLRNSFLWDRIIGFYPSLSTSISNSILIGTNIVYLSNENTGTEISSAPLTSGEEIISGDCDIRALPNSWDDKNSGYLGSNFTWYLFQSTHPVYGSHVPTTITFIEGNVLPRVVLDLVWGNE